MSHQINNTIGTFGQMSMSWEEDLELEQMQMEDMKVAGFVEIVTVRVDQKRMDHYLEWSNKLDMDMITNELAQLELGLDDMVA